MILSEITSLEQLNKNLNMGPGYGGYLDIFRAIKLPKSEWGKFCHWKENRYTRNCLSNCDEYELLMMCWDKDHHSPIHGYDHQEGWVKVLEGKLIIEIYRIDRDRLSCELDETIEVEEKEYTYLNDSMGFHRVRNGSEGKTVSLHLHSSKVNQWEIFRECKKEFEMVKPTYDSKTKNCSD